MALTEGLVAYWQLNDNSKDGVGSNNGTDTSITYSAGKVGYCAVFNGTSSGILLPTMLSSTSGTFNIWIKTTTTTTKCIWAMAYSTSALRLIRIAINN